MKTYLFFLSFFISLSVLGQQDSIHFAHQAWENKEVKKGIIWKKAHFNYLFGGEQEINIVEIDLKKYHKKLKLAGVPKGTKLTSTFAQENNAIVAINGGFFNTRKGGGHDFIKIDRQIINVSSNNFPRANAYFVFDRKRIDILPQTKDSTNETAPDNVLLAGPLLLYHSQTTDLSTDKFDGNKHPRTVVAIKGNTLIFLTADGRNKKSHGLSLYELSKFLSWYGCQSAMNLDGGGSTTMYIAGEPDNGIVNYPSDNKKFDHLGEREVANIIYIKN